MTATPITKEQVALEKPVTTGTPMTWDEFFAWMDEDTLAEWVDGKVVMKSPNTGPHQKIAALVHLLLWRFLRQTQRGDVWIAPMLMRLPSRPSGREPDVLVLLSEHMDRYQVNFIDGPADLVVEIVSEESQGRDRGEKFAEYEAAGIPEYWLIDPLRENADFYRLDERGRYRRVDLDADGRYRCAVLPGFYVEPAWFWQAQQIDPGEAVDFVRAMLA